MASASYLARGTPRLFADTAQVEDVTLTLSALANNAGIVSAVYDQGTGSKPALWEWRLHCQLTGTNVVGSAIEVYCFTSDNVNMDGAVTANAALPSDKRNNAKLAGLLIVDQTTTNTTMNASGVILIATRYFCMGVWNASSLPFRTDTAVHGLVMTPLWWEAQ